MTNKNFIQLQGELFEAVQSANIFADSKTFVDARPKSDPKKILHLYKTHVLDKDFNLKQFIEEHFLLPPPHSNNPNPNIQNLPMKQYIKALWSTLYRPPDIEWAHSTLIPLPYSYVVPGGRFREIYYWDSYFTALGLVASDKKDIALNIARNFAYLIETVGHIPNGNRFYLATRSQPPFFAFLVELLGNNGNSNAVKEFLPAIQKEYAFWEEKERTYTIEHYTLQHYWDSQDTPRQEAIREDLKTALHSENSNIYRDLRAGAESGWDYSSRWFKDEQHISTINTTAILPIDLNCLLYYIELRLSDWSRHKNKYRDKAKRRKQAILNLMWNDKENFFFDYNYQEQKQTSIWSLAAIFPLFVEIATKEQAEIIASHLQKSFLQAGGLVTTLNQTGEQWDWPNGWAPLQWIAVKGLQNYGYTELAKEIKKRWLNTCEDMYKRNGTLFEKYNVVDDVEGSGGEYTVQTGFGWTNGVVLDFLKNEG